MPSLAMAWAQLRPFHNFRQFVEVEKALIDRISEQSSEAFIDELLENLDSDLKHRENLSLVSKKMAAELKVRWTPVQDFILSQFDHRMGKLLEEALISKISKDESPVVIADQFVEPPASVRGQRWE